MKSNGRWMKNAGAGALAVMMTTSVFAAPAPARNDRGNDGGNGRHNNQRNESRGDSRRTYRNNERVNISGSVSAFSRERDGYRVYLDRNRDSYWIPSSRLGNRGRDLRVGVSVVLGGIFRGGRIDVDAISWPGDRGGAYRDDYVRGTVERVDYRNGVLLLRESATRRTIEVDMRDTRRTSRIDLGDLRRGDEITVSGEWLRGGVFSADRIESVNSGRW